MTHGKMLHLTLTCFNYFSKTTVSLAEFAESFFTAYNEIKAAK